MGNTSTSINDCSSQFSTPNMSENLTGATHLPKTQISLGNSNSIQTSLQQHAHQGSPSVSYSGPTTPMPSVNTHLGVPIPSTCSPVVCSNLLVCHGQMVFSSGSTKFIPTTIIGKNGSLSAPPSSRNHHTANPFVLKLKNKQLRVCQSCRSNYDGPNDTLGLVIARAEQISNPSTGSQFTKECTSHYHARRLNCLVQANASFKGTDLVIPADVMIELTVYQKIYLATLLHVPITI